MTDLANLETFVTAVRSGSFAAAARQLGLSPAMVGRRIQALEEQHGARLIERTTRAQRLTELGESFFAQAQTVLEAAAELEELTRSDPGRLRGRIRMSGPTTLGIKRLAPIVAEFCAARPEVTVEISLSDRRVDLVAEGFDLAVRVGELQPSGMVARRVGTYRFVVCAAPSYLGAHGEPRTPDELQQARCILNLNITPRNQWPFIGPGGGIVTALVEGGLQIDNGEALRAAAVRGAGLAYMPVDLVEEDLAAGTLVAVLTHWQTPTLPIHTLHPSRRLVPRRVSALIEAISAGMKQ
jgi:DNA-binding transcriptional LysR family regulator